MYACMSDGVFRGRVFWVLEDQGGLHGDRGERKIIRPFRVYSESISQRQNEALAWANFLFSILTPSQNSEPCLTRCSAYLHEQSPTDM